MNEMPVLAAILLILHLVPEAVVTARTVLTLSGIWLLLHHPLASVPRIPTAATKKGRI